MQRIEGFVLKRALVIICRRAHEKRADAMNEQRKEALEIMDQQCEIRQKVLADIGEAAKKLINCSEEKENMDIAAVEALHQAELGLRSLSLVMRQAAVFWKHMEVSKDSCTIIIHLLYT